MTKQPNWIETVLLPELDNIKSSCRIGCNAATHQDRYFILSKLQDFILSHKDEWQAPTNAVDIVAAIDAIRHEALTLADSAISPKKLNTGEFEYKMAIACAKAWNLTAKE